MSQNSKDYKTVIVCHNSGGGVRLIADVNPETGRLDHLRCDNRLKERPRCREVIIKMGLKPSQISQWIALNPEGQEVLLSPGVRKQMKKMIAEGYFEKDSIQQSSCSAT